MPQANAPLGSPAPLLRIEPVRGWGSLGLVELWRSRELVAFLALRDVKVRYKQTLLGVSWALLQPLLTMVVFSVFFGSLARIPSEGVPYPVFALAGLVPWGLFSQGLAAASGSVVANASLVQKVYFPRLIIPLAPLVACLLDFAIALLLLLAIALGYGIPLSPRLLLLAPLTLLAVLASLGVGLWLAALNVRFRDVRYVVPFLVQIWLFATPIAYPTTLVPEAWRPLYALNPMVGVVDGFRWALFGVEPGPGLTLFASTAVVVAACLSGVAFFRRTESVFADLI
jgi:lipopolysaccharide transport system permease protein